MEGELIPAGQLVYDEHFFRKEDIQYKTFRSGEKTISELLVELDIPNTRYQYLVVHVGGIPVAPELWTRIKPKSTHVVVNVVPQGGDSKNIFRLIAVIAIGIVAPYLAAALPGIGAIGTASNAIAAAVIGVVGTLAINAIFPPPVLGNEGSSDEGSPSLTVTGQRNAIAPGSPVVRLYGRRKYWPKNAAVPYIQTEGKDTQYLYMLFDMGYGDIQIEDARIGDTAISQYAEVDMVVHTNVTEPPFKYYTRDVSTETLSIILENANDQGIRTTRINTKTAQIDLAFTSGLTAFNKKGRQYPQVMDIQVDFRLTGQTIWQPFQAADVERFNRSVKINGYSNSFPYNVQNSLGGTALAEGQRDAGGNLVNGFGQFSQYENNKLLPLPIEVNNLVVEGAVIQIFGIPLIDNPDYDPQFPNNNPLEGYRAGANGMFVNASDEIAAGSTFIVNGARYTVTNTVPGGSLQAMQITPSLEADLITSAYYFSREPEEIGVQAIPAANYSYGGFVGRNVANVFQVEDNTKLPFVVQLGLTFADVGQYDIRVIRRTADRGDNFLEALAWTALRSFGEGAPVKLDVPHTLIELRVRATDQLNGVIDTFSVIGTSILTTYPTGFVENPVVVATRNPAWHVLDVLIGASSPNPMPISRVDLVSFSEFAEWCERTNATLNEANFLSDIIIDYRSTIFTVAKTIASFGRGSLVPRDGKYAIIWDELRTIPVQMFTAHNSSKFSANRAFGTIPDVIKISFVDPDSDWQLRDILVTSTQLAPPFQAEQFSSAFQTYSEPSNQNTEGLDYETITLPGCTRYTQAWRDGRYFLASAMQRQYTFSISTDIENLICERGDYVVVQEDVSRIGGLPGRIKAVNGTIITTTEPVDFSLGVAAYRVKIRENDNTMVEYVPTVLIDSFTIDLGIAGAYKVGDLYVWGEFELVTSDFLVKEIQPKSELSATIILQPLAPTVYEADEGVLPPYAPVLSEDLFIAPPPVSNPVATFSYGYPNNRPLIDLILSWGNEDQAVTEAFEIYQFIEEKWKLIDITRDASYFFYQDQDVFTTKGKDIIDTIHYFKVVAIGATGLKQELDKATTFTVTPAADLDVPGAVPLFDVDIVSETAYIDWRPPAVNPEKVAGYMIRFTPDLLSEVAVNWSKSVLLFATDWQTSSSKVNARLGTYMIKPFTWFDVFSDEFTAAQTTVPFLRGVVDYLDVTDAPTWLGTFDRCELVGVTIQNSLVPDPPEGVVEYELESFYYFQNPVILPANFTVRVSSFIDAIGANAFEFMSDWPTLASLPALASPSDADWDVLLEVSVNGGGPDGSWKSFTVSDITGQELFFRVHLTSLRTDLLITVTDAEVDITVPDRTAAAFDIDCPTLGLAVVFDPAFQSDIGETARPVVAITQDTAVTGDYFTITNLDRLGFTIQFFDSLATPKQSFFDWSAIGFGTQALAPINPN